MALTDIRIPESRSPETERFAAEISREGPRAPVRTIATHRFLLAAAVCLIVAVASVLALPAAVATAWSLVFLLAISSAGGAGGFAVLIAKWFKSKDGAAQADLGQTGAARSQFAMQGPPWRPSESQNEAARAQVEFATSETASLVRDHFQELAVRLGAEQAKLTEALDLYGQSIQARLNSSSVALAREFRDSGEQLSKRIEAAGESAVAGIARQGEAVIFAMGRSAGDVDRRMTERTREALAQIDGAVATTADAIASMSENAAARLRQVLNDISEGAAASLNQQLQQTETHHRALATSAEGGGRALGEQAAEAAGLIESKLQGAASTLERLVDDALQRIDAKIGARVGELNERLNSVESDLDRQWGERRSGVAAEFAAAADETRAAIAAAAAQVGRAANEAVNSAREDFAQSIQLSMQQLADATESSAQRVGHATDQAMQTLTRSESDITVRLDAFETAVTARAAEVGRAASEAVTSAKHDFSQSVELSVQQLADATETSAQRVGRATEQALQTLTRSESDMTARLDAFETVVTARSETISERMAAQSLAMGGALEAMDSLLGRQGRALIEALDASTSTLRDAFEARLKDADARMLAWRDAWEQAFATHVRLLEEGSRDGAASLHSLAAEHRAAAIASLEAHRASVAGDLASAFATLQEQLGAREREASANLLRVAREMADGVANELSTLVDALGTRGEGLRERIAARQAELIEVFEKGAVKTEISVSRSLGSTANSIEALAKRIGEDLDRRGHALAQTMEQTKELVLGALTGRMDEARTSIAAGAADAVETFEASRRDLLSSLAQGVQDAAAALNSGAEGNLQTLEARISETTQALAAAQTSATESAARFLSDAKAVFASGTVEAEKSISSGRERLVAALAETARVGAEDLSRRGLESQRALEGETAKAVERLEASRATLAGAAAQAAERFAGNITEQMTQLQRAMTQGADKLRREFAEPLAETLARVEADGAELAGATRVLAETLVSASSTHRDQLHQAFARAADSLTATVASNAETFRRDFEATVASADGVFLSRGFELAKTLAGRISEMRALLEGEGLPLLKALDSQSAGLSQQIDAASQRSLNDFERKATVLIGLLTRRGDDLLSSMTAAASETARKVAQLKDDADATAARADASLRDIERKVGVMLEMLDKRAGDGSTPPAPGQGPAQHANDAA